MDFKRCRRCGVVKRSSEFHRHKGRPGGLQDRCKACHVDANRQSRLNNPAANRERNRHRSAMGVDRARKAAWRRANREKVLAQKAVARAVEAGRLVRPGTCERCGVGSSVFRIEAHHDDYSHRLDVMWLCSPCHGQRHLELAAQPREIREIVA